MREQEEECGVHVHCYQDHKYMRKIDDTYGKVCVDGFDLDHNMLRTYMAQCAFPHLREAVSSIHCPRCNVEHYDDGKFAYKPHHKHICQNCNQQFFTDTPCIGNPIKRILEKLASNSKLPGRLHNGYYINSEINWTDIILEKNLIA